MRSNPGISAFASTMILLFLAALLGVVVMSWGTNIAQAMPNDCSKVTLSITTEGDSVMVVPKMNNIACNEKRLDVSEIIP
jgi:membrane glycosyltransferase